MHFVTHASCPHRAGPVCKSSLKTLNDAIFDLNAADQTKNIPKDNKAGMIFGNKVVKKDDSLPYWDLNKSFMQRTGGGSLSDGVAYTHAFVLKWRASDSGWRTLLRHNNDHCIIVKAGSKDLGMYSNRNGAFRDSGYNVRAHVQLLAWVCGNRIETV